MRSLMATDVALVRHRIRDSLIVQEALLTGSLPDQVAELAATVVDSLAGGGKVILFGNGGSAADATHLAAELVGRFVCDRPALGALSLTDNASSVSAIGNDYGYEHVFARQIEGLGRPGDVAIGMSTSGNAANVIAGLRAALAGDLRTAAITGQSGGRLVDEVELCLRMPARATARIQECTMLVGHALCELVEKTLFTP